MKKTNIIFSILAITVSLMFTSCVVFAKEVKGSGKLITKTLSISDFSKVEIETSVEINYSQDKNSGSLKFSVDENLWEYYDIYTTKDVLHIKIKREYKNKVNLRPTKCLITVSSEQLKSIAIAGGAKFNFVTAFSSNKLDISLAGSGKIDASQHSVKLDECKIEIAGSGGVQLAGKVKEAEIEIAGSGGVKALDCEITTLKVEIAGSGNAEVSVKDKLNVSIAGSGNVKFKGDPDVKTDIAGSGKVKKL